MKLILGFLKFEMRNKQKKLLGTAYGRFKTYTWYSKKNHIELVFCQNEMDSL